MREIQRLRIELRSEPPTHSVGSMRLDATVNGVEHTITLPVLDTDDFVSRMDMYFDAMKKLLAAVV